MALADLSLLCDALVAEDGDCPVLKSSSRPGPWSHLVCSIFAQFCVLMVWSLPPVVVSLQIAQLHGFVGSDLSFTICHRTFLVTGALVATSDVSCVKLSRELKSWRHILLVTHGVLPRPCLFLPPSWWLGEWCAVAKEFVSYVKLSDAERV